jgi:hypothetical protein
LAPRKLAPTDRRLPPILYRKSQNSTSGYSKASWGLSVLPRVTSIFTGTAISPGSPSRQCPSRYSIRAGRNLPDKEFRSVSPALSRRTGLYLHPSREPRTVLPILGAWRIVSEDPSNQKTRGFLRIVQSSTFLLIASCDRVVEALRMFPHIARLSFARLRAMRQRYVTLGRL